MTLWTKFNESQNWQVSSKNKCDVCLFNRSFALLLMMTNPESGDKNMWRKHKTRQQNLASWETEHIQQKLFETSQRTQPDLAAFYDICMASRWIRHSLIRSHTQRAHITELRNTTTQYANYQYSHVKTCEKFPKSQSANQRSNDIGKKLTVPQYQWMQLLVHFMQY